MEQEDCCGFLPPGKWGERPRKMQIWRAQGPGAKKKADRIIGEFSAQRRGGVTLRATNDASEGAREELGKKSRPSESCPSQSPAESRD